MQEIIYTSAQKGLKPGSSGFCTVICTAGMDQRTAQRLEGLSGYRHPFDLNDPRNPVNYQHITMRIGAANTHVLSRVCDAGPDHTGRTNKLAHHVAFTQPPSPSGPARLFEADGAFVSKWDGTTSQRPPRTLPSIPVEDATLTAWASVAGDGGWAGHIAEQLISGKQPIHVLFSPGTDTLSLLKEVLDVVPPNRRWVVTFSTYYTNPIAGAECQLRFVLNDTKDATKLRNDARSVVVDLTAPLTQATGGDLVTIARGGRVEQTVSAPKKQAQQKVTPTKAAAVESSAVDEWIEPDSDNSIPAATASASAPTPPPQATNLFGAQRAQKEQRLAAAGNRSSTARIVALVFGVLLLLGTVSGGIWLAITNDGSDVGAEKLLAESAEKRKAAELLKQRKEKEAQAKEQKEEAERAKQESEQIAEQRRKMQEFVESKKQRERERERDQEKKMLAEQNSKPKEQQAQQPVDVFGQILSEASSPTDPVVLVIPWQDKLLGSSNGGVSIPVDDVADIEIKLLHHKRGYEIRLEEKNNWVVLGGVKPRSSVARIQYNGKGRLLLEHENLDDPVPWGVLQISLKNRCGFVLFRKPELNEPVRLSSIMDSPGKASWSVLSEKELDKSATIDVKIKNGGQPVSHNVLDLEKGGITKAECSLTQSLNRKTRFNFTGGTDGAEHRHIIELNYENKVMALSHSLELVKRGWIPRNDKFPRKPINRADYGIAKVLWDKWLRAQMLAFQKSYRKRVWKKFDGDASDWANSAPENLEDAISDTEKGAGLIVEQLPGWKGNTTTAVMNQFLRSVEANENWESVKALTDRVRDQPRLAAEFQKQLSTYDLHFSVYQPILGKVKLPHSDKEYKMRIPILEFSDRKNDKLLNWKDILSETNGQRPSPGSQGVNGGPGPPKEASPEASIPSTNAVN